MTKNCGGEITTTGEFTDELRSLLSEAIENGVDVEGGWLVQSLDEETPDWDIEIWRVQHTDRKTSDR